MAWKKANPNHHGISATVRPSTKKKICALALENGMTLNGVVGKILDEVLPDVEFDVEKNLEPVGKVKVAIEDTREKLTKIKKPIQIQVVCYLTPEQYIKLNEIKEEANLSSGSDVINHCIDTAHPLLVESAD